MSGIREVAFSGGIERLEIGQTFVAIGAMWKIVEFGPERIYGPSSFGGTPFVACRIVDGILPDGWERYQKDGKVDWCGDSVAAMVASNRRAGP